VDPASQSTMNYAYLTKAAITNYDSSQSFWFNSPGPWINVYGSGTSTQQLNFLTYNSSNLVNLSTTGNVIAYASDKRLKGNIRPIKNALAKVLQLNGVIYNWNETACKIAGFDGEKDEVGVFAQEVQEVLPQVVSPAPFDMDY
jgi:hypothetical protein